MNEVGIFRDPREVAERQAKWDEDPKSYPGWRPETLPVKDQDEPRLTTLFGSSFHDQVIKCDRHLKAVQQEINIEIARWNKDRHSYIWDHQDREKAEEALRRHVDRCNRLGESAEAWRRNMAYWQAHVDEVARKGREWHERKVKREYIASLQGKLGI